MLTIKYEDNQLEIFVKANWSIEEVEKEIIRELGYLPEYEIED